MIKEISKYIVLIFIVIPKEKKYLERVRDVFMFQCFTGLRYSDVENLKRNLLLFTQIKDLEIPAILVINMADQMKIKGISLDIQALETALKTKIALISSRKATGITELKKLIVE